MYFSFMLTTQNRNDKWQLDVETVYEGWTHTDLTFDEAVKMMQTHLQRQTGQHATKTQ